MNKIWTWLMFVKNIMISSIIFNKNVTMIFTLYEYAQFCNSHFYLLEEVKNTVLS